MGWDLEGEIANSCTDETKSLLFSLEAPPDCDQQRHCLQKKRFSHSNLHSFFTFSFFSFFPWMLVFLPFSHHYPWSHTVVIHSDSRSDSRCLMPWPLEISCAQCCSSGTQTHSFLERLFVFKAALDAGTEPNPQ